MKVLLTCMFFLCTALSLAADTTFTVSGKITDVISGQPLKSATVNVYGTSAGTITDEAGNYSLTITTDEKVNLVISFIGYRTEVIEIKELKDQVVNVRLSRQAINLKEVPVISGAEIVHGSQQYNIIDYEIGKDYLMLMVYEKKPSKSKLLLINDSNKIVSTHLVPETPSGFFKDCVGNIHVVTDNYAFQTEVTDSATFELYPRSLPRFNAFTKPCVASINEHYYFGNYGPGRMSIQYVYTNTKDSTRNVFRYIEDTLRLKQYLDEPARLPSLQRWSQDYVRGGEEVPLGLGRMIGNEQRHGEAFRKHWYKYPVFTPVVAIDKNIYLFNHYEGKIEKYTADARPLSDIPISYHKQKNWEHFILADEKTGKAYTVFFKNGITEIKEINLETGNLKDVIKVNYKYIEKIKILDGELYFLYQPFESLQKKYLYRQKL